MTTQDIINEFARIKKEEPEKFYHAMGYGDDGVNIMDRFVSGSYELGLIAGAKYALEHFTRVTISARDILPGVPARGGGQNLSRDVARDHAPSLVCAKGKI